MKGKYIIWAVVYVVIAACLLFWNLSGNDEGHHGEGEEHGGEHESIVVVDIL